MKSVLFKSFQQNENWLRFVSFSILLIYSLPYFYFGESFPVQIWDNADSLLATYKVALESGGFFPSVHHSVDNIMNGTPISSIYVGPNLHSLILLIFGYYWGYAVNKLIIMITAFGGMYFLLSRHLLPAKENKIIVYGASVAFAILPFWSFNISVAGVPLVLYIFYNKRKHINKISDWFLLLFFTLGSSIVVIGIFLIILLGFVGLIDYIRLRKINFVYLKALVFFLFSYIACNYLLFYNFLFNTNYISHRTDRISKLYDFKEMLNKAYVLFTKSQIHTISLQDFFIIPTSIIALIILIYTGKSTKKLLSVVGLIVLFSIWYAIEKWSGFLPFYNFLYKIIPISFYRFNWLNPALWGIAFAISLSVIWQFKTIGKILSVIIIICQIGYGFKSHEYLMNRYFPSFKAFYAEKQFKSIKNSIKEPIDSYRVGSVGLHPAIALFNGFYCLDAYVVDYSLQYKQDFRKIIEHELDREPKLKKYFNNWGSRCYFFSSELANPLSAEFVLKDYLKTKQINQLSYNYEQFKKMGGKYIISSVPINDSVHLNLKNTFEDEESNWTIYLYYVL